MKWKRIATAITHLNSLIEFHFTSFSFIRCSEWVELTFFSYYNSTLNFSLGNTVIISFIFNQSFPSIELIVWWKKVNQTMNEMGYSFRYHSSLSFIIFFYLNNSFEFHFLRKWRNWTEREEGNDEFNWIATQRNEWTLNLLLKWRALTPRTNESNKLKWNCGTRVSNHSIHEWNEFTSACGRKWMERENEWCGSKWPASCSARSIIYFHLFSFLSVNKINSVNFFPRLAAAACLNWLFKLLSPQALAALNSFK